MHKKLLPFILFILLFQSVKSQQEFITIWKPSSIEAPAITVDAPYQANSEQIWFPGIGENYTIYWEEIDYPQHNGTLTNVTSSKQVLIDFGTPHDRNGATYRVKVSNGNGIFQQIKFGEPQVVQIPDQILFAWQMNGSADKILEIEQWGNISWTTMNSAFSNCKLIQLTATDAPFLENVTDTSFMFYGTTRFTGASSMQNWDTSKITNFRCMFSLLLETSLNISDDQFNSPYIGGWDMSSATDLSYMLSNRRRFNQPLNNWNVSKVKDMSWMFANCFNFNQPLNNWDTSNLEDIHFMFHLIPVFNQPLNNWNTSKVTNMSHVFHGCESFNQPLESWDMTNVTKIDQFLYNASDFNQPLGKWNLASVTNAFLALKTTALDCDNYSRTLTGWANNPDTADNVPLGPVYPAQYAPNIINKRDILINKGWNITDDEAGSCFLSLSELKPDKKPVIYPNPAVDDIHIDGLKDIKNYKIFDMSGKLIKEGNPSKDMINISSLSKGSYILYVILKDRTVSSKFIKK